MIRHKIVCSIKDKRNLEKLQLEVISSLVTVTAHHNSQS